MGFVYFYLAFTAFQNLRMACKHLMLKWDERKKKEKHMKKTHKSQPSRFIPQTPEIKLDSSTSFTLTSYKRHFPTDRVGKYVHDNG